MHRIEFICQREQTIYPHDSCHVVCLLMLLKFVNFSPLPSYEDLCKSLNASNDGFNPDEDLSVEETIRFVVKNNLNFRAIFRKEIWEKTLKIAPVMAAMYGCRRFWGEEGHMIILTQFKEGIFTYLDPWFPARTNRHVKTISIESFYKYYGGFAFQLLP